MNPAPRGIIVLVIMTGLAGCYSHPGPLLLENPKFDETAIFGVHAWWNSDDRVTIRWYVVNLGSEPWVQNDRGTTLATRAQIRVMEPDGDYHRGDLTGDFAVSHMILPGHVVPFERLTERVLSPNVRHDIRAYASTIMGDAYYIDACVAKARPIDLGACESPPAVTLWVYASEAPTYYPMLREKVQWLPPPVDVPESHCTWDLRVVHCDATAWNWMNTSAVVAGEAVIHARENEESPSVELARVALWQNASFDGYETRDFTIETTVDAQTTAARAVAPEGELLVTWRVWRVDLPKSLYEGHSVVELARP